MRRHVSHWLALRWVALLGALLWHCESTDSPVAGGTTETTNGIVGWVTNEQGVPVAGASVRLRTSDYLAYQSPAALGKSTLSAHDAFTDAQGQFAVSDIKPGSYLIEITDEESTAVVIELAVGPDDTALDLGTRIMRPFAQVQGTVASNPAMTAPSVLIYGLERVARADSASGAYAIADLPPGTFTLRIEPPSPAFGASLVELRDLQPGDVSHVAQVTLVELGEEDYARWAHTRAIRINTAASGAAISAEVHRFPLLAVLDRSHIDFSQLQPKGRDLRFAKPDGSPLRYEIEYWDSAAGQAAVWVLVDTIRALDSTQSFTMLWGNAAAPDFSNGRAVFDSADGYTGVWHVNRYRERDTLEALLDASMSDAHAITYGAITTNAVVPGHIGTALSLDGSDDYLRSGAVGSQELHLGVEDLTLSAWVQAQPAPRYQGVFALDCQNDNRLRLLIDNTSGQPWFGIRHAAVDQWIETKGTSDIADGRWHLVTMVFDRDASASLYVDGRLDTTLDISAFADIPLDSAAVTVGFDNFSSGSYLGGLLDEIRVIRRAVSPVEVWLAFVNQQQPERLLMYE